MTSPQDEPYTWATRHLYVSPPCPKCGGTDMHIQWRDASTSGNPDAWLPSIRTCLNQSCPGQMPDPFADLRPPT